jgi:hypothetical protein
VRQTVDRMSAMSALKPLRTTMRSAATIVEVGGERVGRHLPIVLAQAARDLEDGR